MPVVFFLCVVVVHLGHFNLVGNSPSSRSSQLLMLNYKNQPGPACYTWAVCFMLGQSVSFSTYLIVRLIVKFTEQGYYWIVSAWGLVGFPNI